MNIIRRYIGNRLLVVLAIAWIYLRVLFYIICYRNIPIIIKIFLITVLSLISCLLWYIVFLQEKDKKKVFLLFIFLAFIYMTALPFRTVPDENRHFMKIYAITEGVIFPWNNDGTVLLPGNLEFDTGLNFKYKETVSDMKRYADYDNMQQYDLSSTTLYFPAVYFPQILGFLIAKLFTDNLFVIATIGRFFAFVVTLCGLLISYKLLPVGKNLLLLIALNPRFIELSCSLSGDAFENTICLIYISYILHIVYDETVVRVRLQDIITLMCLSTAISLGKMFYLPVCFMCLLLPAKKFCCPIIQYNNCQKPQHYAARKFVYVSVILITTVILSMLWLYLGMHTSIRYNGGANGHEQLNGILNGKTNYFFILLKTLIENSYFYVMDIFGLRLGWVTYPISAPVLKIVWILSFFVTAYVLDEGEIKIAPFSKVLILIVDTVVVFIVFTTEYMQWSSVGSNIIDGVQGRYFIPLLLPTLLLFKKKTVPDYFYYYKFIIMIAVLVNMLEVTNMISRYIG